MKWSGLIADRDLRMKNKLTLELYIYRGPDYSKRQLVGWLTNVWVCIQASHCFSYHTSGTRLHIRRSYVTPHWSPAVFGQLLLRLLHRSLCRSIPTYASLTHFSLRIHSLSLRFYCLTLTFLCLLHPLFYSYCIYSSFMFTYVNRVDKYAGHRSQWGNNLSSQSIYTYYTHLVRISWHRSLSLLLLFCQPGILAHQRRSQSWHSVPKILGSATHKPIGIFPYAYNTYLARDLPQRCTQPHAFARVILIQWAYISYNLNIGSVRYVYFHSSFHPPPCSDAIRYVLGVSRSGSIVSWNSKARTILFATLLIYLQLQKKLLYKHFLSRTIANCNT